MHRVGGSKGRNCIPLFSVASPLCLSSNTLRATRRVDAADVGHSAGVSNAFRHLSRLCLCSVVFWRVEPDLSGAPGAPATILATPYSTWQSDFSEGKYSGRARYTHADGSRCQLRDGPRRRSTSNRGVAFSNIKKIRDSCKTITVQGRRYRITGEE